MSLDLALRRPEPAHVARPWWHRPRRWAVLATVLGFAALCLVWRLDGGRWERVETPSMGTVAPVGTLLWVKPVDFATLRPGDFITFRPPGSTGQTYSHRVLAREPDGRITTKGVLSAPDPWRLGPHDVVGSVRMRWWGAGWLVAAAPMLLAGALLTAMAARLATVRWKAPVVLVAVALTLSAVITWYRPLVNAEQLAFAPVAGGGADATYVGTGLLPIRLTAHDGPSVVMRAGQVGTVHVRTADATGKLRVTLAPDIPWWWWAALVGACFVPAGAASLSGSRRTGQRASGVVRSQPRRPVGGQVHAA